MGFCRKCGAQLPEDAQFCMRCGTPVAIAAPPPPPPAAHAQPHAQPRRPPWWITPAAVVGLVLLAWLLIAGPLRRDEPGHAPRAQTETIAEGPVEPPPQTGTLVEVPPGSTDDSFEITTATTTIAAPPIADAPPPNVTPATTTPATPTPGATVTAAPPAISTQPSPQPRPVTPPPAPSRAELTPDEATATLRNYVRSTRYYDVAGECIRVENNGYRNAGYALEVWHSCPGSGGGSRLLGRWRVDAKTREVFRQRDDGRYLRP